MKVLVTGGSGFIGSHLVEALVKRGHEIRCLVRKTSNVEHLRKLGVELVYGDITWPESLDKALDGVDIVYHLVGGGDVSTISKRGYRKLYELNVTSVETVLKACSVRKIQKFILFSSVSATGVKKGLLVNENTPCDPQTPHELVKYESEQVALRYCYESKIPLVIIRPTQVYGPGDTKSEILKMCRLIEHHCFPVMGNGHNVVPMVYIHNLCEAAVSAGERDRASGVYIVTDKSHSMNEIVATIAKEVGTKVWAVHIPIFLARIGVGLVEMVARILHFTPPFNLSRVGSITSDRLYDVSKARDELGYETKVSLADGIRRTVAWYRQVGWLPEGKQTSFSFRLAYLLAVVEGEGLGTAYEYIVKHDLIRKVFDQVGRPKSILVAGLPEKYGFSMDFVSIAGRLGAEIVIADEREEKLESFSQRFSKAKELGLLSNLRLNIALISDWCNVSLERTFDLIISCEVLQRMSQVMRAKYLRQLAGMADTLVFFAPNAENTAHAKISKLQALRLDELTDLSKSSNLELLASGYIDMPPFPPGLKWAGSRRRTTLNRGLQKVMMSFLTLWSHLENALGFLKAGNSHMVYCISKTVAGHVGRDE